MIVSDIKLLADLLGVLRSMAQRKGELDKTYFEQFIKPAWDAFKAVHEDYKKSFKEYGELIVKPDYDVTLLMEKLHEDSVYSQDLRVELVKIVDNLRESNRSARVDLLDEFIVAIKLYFDGKNPIVTYPGNGEPETWMCSTSTIEPNLSPLSLLYDRMQEVYSRRKRDAVQNDQIVFGDNNVFRAPLNVYLLRRGADTNREHARRLILRCTQDIQSRYQDVSESYHRLRTDLLS